MADATASFARCFGHAPEAVVSAPGRVNLLGEHTDYNLGYVLPTALPLTTQCAISLRDDRRIRVYSGAIGELAELQVDEHGKRGDWVDYVVGVTWALAEAGFATSGFDMAIESTVPQGGGLSSSAALEVACLRALRDRYALPIDDLAIARLAQRGESGYVGVPVGMLDPLACSLADPSRALFIDTRTMAIEPVALPDAMDLAVIDSGVVHDHSTGSYRVRRSECEQAAGVLGVESLRDATLADLPRLPAPLDARARHVITENQRVLDGVRALRAGDLVEFGAQLFATHASLRDDYLASVEEADALVEHARRMPDVFGARITGGGFGGAVVVVVRHGRALDVARALTGDASRILLPVST